MPPNDIEKLSPKEYIIIKGARLHNLKNLSVAIPRNKLVVVTGLSGSGKSTLAFDTLYAEGQRRYVESLSSYARQFVGRMNKPEVDYIKGISPAIAIEQKVNTRNPRSTVGTSTEIYDYLKLLFARIGKTYSPVSGDLVKRNTVTDVVEFVTSLDDGTKLLLFTDLHIGSGRTIIEELQVLLQKGFSRIKSGDQVMRVEDVLDDPAKGSKVLSVDILKKPKSGKESSIKVLIDRLIFQQDDIELPARIADSVQTAFFEGHGECHLEIPSENGTGKTFHFSNRFEMDGISFEEPSTHLFSFNNPFGACKKCEGFGSVIGVDEDLVIPNKGLSVFEAAIACWRGEKMKEWNDKLVQTAYKFDFPVHRPWHSLSDSEKRLIWDGNKYFKGLHDFFKFLEEQSYKIQYRVMLSRYRGKTSCPECHGTRLRADANYVKLGGLSITDIVLLPVEKSLKFFKNFEPDDHDLKISKRLLTEITGRLGYLNEVGLGYLTLNRLSNTLSGGESQRINLATSLGSSLVGSMYILDEPSIGLHPRDTQRLVKVLEQLKNLGNTVIVVEHEEEVMKAADDIIDIGPRAGAHGGELVFQGNFNEIQKSNESLTGLYLSGKKEIGVPVKRRKWSQFIELKGVRENNLKGFDVKFPLKVITAITGVSGSGKTSLVKHILYPALKKLQSGYIEQTGLHDALEGAVNQVHSVEFVDQNPIGKSSRSNPVTYVKAYDEIRELYSDMVLAKTRKYKPSSFSFNVEGGRCETCQGEGEVTIEMQFLADIHLTCESCGGKRFKEEVLEVEFNGKNIYDILELTVDEAIDFFSSASNHENLCSKILAKLAPLAEVGLGYIQLGQSSNTLSGGEAQRIKLASFLSKGNIHDHTVFFFDEPTTGLHFHDISKLLKAFEALINQGNSVIIIEHNMEVIKCTDWVIDLGPEGGEHGGNLVFEGVPEDLINCKESHTGKHLRSKLG
jgi:excinuclease ABC subunit A